MIEQLIDKHWDELFHEICKIHDDLHELKIEYQEKSTGKTIIRSWKDRDKFILEGENK